MSMKTWKAEFYPIPASRCAKKRSLQHSLLKWTGLLKKHLKKHGLEQVDRYWITDSNGSEFYLDDKTCALCIWHIQDCTGCPLVLWGGGDCFDDGNPYMVFGMDSDARPMIRALKKAIKASEKK